MGCASLHRTDPPQVTLVGIEPAAGEGLEERMQLKLRVQNPNDSPIEYDGVYVELDLQGKSFGTGVSNQRGTVPSFGEAVVTVPVTVSVLGIVREAIGLVEGKPTDKITYELRGKLNSTTSGALQFKSQGEFTLPTSATPTGDAVKRDRFEAHASYTAGVATQPESAPPGSMEGRLFSS
jgi:LEA14-like dessication related protein